MDETPNQAETNNTPPAAEPQPAEPIEEAQPPIKTAPIFPTDQPAKKSKAHLIAILASLFIIGAGVATWFITHPNNSSNTSVQNDIEPAPALEPVEASKLALKGNGLSDFDLAFLHLENKQDNVVYSPLSMKYALAMLKDGANDRSKEQIEAVIGDYKAKAYLNSANRSLANAIFIRDSFTDQILPSYTDTLKTNYNASVMLDPFTSAANVNKWVGDQTLGIINNFVEDGDVKDLDFLLVNALAIDMNWNKQLQCAPSQDTDVPCTYYNIKYAHESYNDYIPEIFDAETFEKITFGDHENVKSAKIGASINRYDIVKELGEDKIRETVEAGYQEWVRENHQRLIDAGTYASEDEIPAGAATADEFYRQAHAGSDGSYDGLNQYIQELGENYGKTATSTDFYFLDTDAEKVFAKDLKEYDGSTLQYIGIMPKTGSLNAYLNNLTAEKATNLIANLKDPSDVNNFKDGVVTKITAHIPFFKLSYEMKNFQSNLQQLGITDVFDQTTADLTNIVPQKGEYIDAAIHKADIDFSNDGIRAAAATGMGGRGAAGPWDYKFDVPVEEIDLTFDKPFLFLIHDKSTGEVWFTGTVYNPANN